MQSVHITANVVNSNPADGEVYSMQQYAIKFVSDLRQVYGFSPGTPFSYTNKTATISLKYCWNGVKHHKPYPYNLVD
jgi:hypothetical protein